MKIKEYEHIIIRKGRGEFEGKPVYWLAGKNSNTTAVIKWWIDEWLIEFELNRNSMGWNAEELTEILDFINQIK